CKSGLGDVPHTTIHLDGVARGVDVVHAEQPARRVFDGARIPQIPAPAIVPQDNLTAPTGTAIVTDPCADSEGAHPVAVDAGDPAILHLHEIAGRAPVRHT